MAATLRRLPVLAGVAVVAGICAEAAGQRAFTRLVRREVQALQARAFPGRAGVVTEEMLAGLPEPVRRYLRYTGVVGRPVPGTIRLHQEGRMRPGPGQPWLPLEAEEHYSVQPPGFVWVGDPETWSTPVTGYGEFGGLRLPARGKAIYKLPGGDLDYIDVTITGLHYDTCDGTTLVSPRQDFGP